MKITMRIVKDSAVVVTVAVALLAGLEGSLRVIYPGAVPQPDEIAYRFDPTTLIALKPNIEKRYERSDWAVPRKTVWRTNSFGYRGLSPKKDYQTRIIVYGDSNVQARFSRHSDTFPVRIGAHLQPQLEGLVDVLNAGLIGSGPDQSYRRMLSSFDAGLSPDVIVFHIFADNDFGDLVRNRLVELDDQGRLVDSGHPATVDELLAPPRLSWMDQLYVVRATLRVWKAVVGEEADGYPLERLLSLTSEEYDVYAARLPRRFSHFADHYDVDLAVAPGGESAIVKLALMEAVLRDLQAAARSNGAYLLVVVQPAAVDLGVAMADVLREELEQYEDYRPDRLSSSVEQICVRLGVPVVNLYGPYREEGPEDLYLPNGHWNEKGQEVAAQLTAEYLLKHYYLGSTDPR